MTIQLSLPSNTDHTASSPPVARRPVPPIVLAMVSQGVAGSITLLLLYLLPVPDAWGELGAALCHGIIAALVGRAAGLATWWLPINVLFVPAALLATGSSFEPQWCLVAFIALALVYWSTYRTQVPLYLTSASGCRVISEILARENGRRFLDIGSGSGSVLAHLTQRFPQTQCDGVELAPIPYLISRARLLTRHNCQVRWIDFWRVDLSKYDVVYAYLSPVPMSALWEKVRREMRPGSLFISNSFPIVGITPQEILNVPGPIKRKLYLWRM